MKPTLWTKLAAVLWLFLAACSGDADTDKPIVERDTVRDTVYVAANTAADSASFLDPSQIPVTMPVLDALFADSTFAVELRDSLQLTDTQIMELRKAAREQSNRLGNDTAAVDSTMTPGTAGARMYALQRIGSIIGPEKAYALGRLVRNRWGATPEGLAMGATPNTVPTDTRVVINAPAFRMDLFENGQLVKSWPIAAGYPEFPLPTGMRQAKEIIFNPTWTPPDEPWVEGSKDVKVGEKVAAGSPQNPLGIMKIPIGLPSLIHGGKSAGQIGTFGSHGCAGLTNEGAREFAKLLAAAAGTPLDDKQITEFGKNKTETKNVQLASAVPVELRYETIVASDGAIHLYPDVYDRGTNTEENLRAVLQAQGLTLEQLTEAERSKLMSSLEQMGGTVSGDSTRRGDTLNDERRATNDEKNKAQSGKVTRTVKGPKELVVPIAALKGKGYPKALKVAAKRPATPAAKKDTTA